MATFEQKVLDYIKEQKLIESRDRLLIACSGGVDSMGLLHFFLEKANKLEIELFVAHVDHMLRGEVSNEDRLFVEDFCQQHNVPVFSTAIPIPIILEEEGGNSQAICRRERYAFFADVMEKNGINKLVTAHHADDQLESVLMSLTRSGTISGMKGMYSKRDFSFGTVIRPFLSVTKFEIREYLEEKGGTFREDLSNEKDDYTRNRFRHHIVPLMKKENLNVPFNAVKIAEYIQQDDDYLNELAKMRFSDVVKEIKKGEYKLDITSLQQEPIALQRRIILILLNYLYHHSNYSYSDTISHLIIELCKSQEGSATIHLPENYMAIRRYSEVLFLSHFNDRHFDEKILLFNKWTELQGFRLYIGDTSSVIFTDESNSSEAYYFSSNVFNLPFKVRPRKEGDRIDLKGMSDKKRLSRLFIDEKIPLNDRDVWPILVDANDEVVAVLGIRVNKNLSKLQRPQDDIKIIIEYNNE